MNRLLEHPWCLDRDIALITGSFAPNGSSAVSAASVKGKGFSVVRTSAGKFTATFDDKFVDVLCILPVLQMHTPDGSLATPGDYTAATSSASATAVIFTMTSGSAADIAANANNRVNFVAVVRTSGVTP